MKKLSNLLTYSGALVVGIMLLVFHEKPTLLHTIVMILGIVLALPSVVMLIRGIIGKKEEDGLVIRLPWYMILVAIAGLGLGLWMIFTPDFFIGLVSYVIGGILILAGIAQMAYIHLDAGGAPARKTWYIMPALTIAGGLIVIIFATSMIAAAINIIAGVLLICYAVNGFACLGREAKDEIESNKHLHVEDAS